MSSCACDSGKLASECCGPLLSGHKVAETPEQLMRSRYSAFCAKDLDYVQRTTDPQALKDFDRASTEAWMKGARFTKLEVLSSATDGNKGRVEFKAHFQMEGKDPEVHHEISKFRRQGGVWYFRDGRVLT